MANREQSVTDPVALALHALTWIMSDADRSARMLGVTGIAPDDLRARAAEPAVLAAVLAFLEAYEPDLIACAGAIATTPEALVAAHGALEA